MEREEAICGNVGFTHGSSSSFPATIIPWNARCVTDYEFLLHLNVCMFSVYSFPSLILLPLQPLGRLCAQLGNKKAQR